MPELPEVETIARDLRPRLVGTRLVDINILDQLIIKYPRTPADFCQRLLGREIKDVRRRGKYLLIPLDDGLTWSIHLRMTGRLLLELPPGEKYLRARFDLDDGNSLWYCDLRRFGDMWAWYPGEEKHLGGYGSLGPEPLAVEFCPQSLKHVVGGRRAPIKALLLNQQIVAGLGNIYVDEALFEAGVDPRRPGQTLTDTELERLCAAIRKVLSRAIEARGTTFRDYRSGQGTAGEFQNQLQVYGHKGLPCPNCAAPLESARVGGRTSVYCPHCQE